MQKLNADDYHPVQQCARHETTRWPFVHAHPPCSVRSNPNANPTAFSIARMSSPRRIWDRCIALLMARSRTGHQSSNSEISCSHKQTNNRRSAGRTLGKPTIIWMGSIPAPFTGGATSAVVVVDIHPPNAAATKATEATKQICA